MPRQGRPPRGAGYNTGTIGKHRIAWLQTYVGQIALMMYPEGFRDDDPDVPPSIKDEPGSSVVLSLIKAGRPMHYALTALTAEELRLMRELFNLAFDLAEPIVEQRDKAAEIAYEAGDDSFVRIYRQVPRLVVREGALRENSVSLRQRPSDAPEGPGAGDAGQGGLRGVGAELADGEPQDPGTQDDGTSAD